MDGSSGTSSYLCDFPNGGVVTLRGNAFQKGPLAQNPSAISYGAEGLTWPVNTLALIHNTVVMTRSGGNFFYLPSLAESLTLTANVFAGTGSPAFLAGGFAIGRAAQSGNVMSDAANIPGADNIALPTFWSNATLLAQIGLTGVPDPSYLRDASRPFTLRDVTGTSRVAGALQASP